MLNTGVGRPTLNLRRKFRFLEGMWIMSCCSSGYLISVTFLFSFSSFMVSTDVWGKCLAMGAAEGKWRFSCCAAEESEPEWEVKHAGCEPKTMSWKTQQIPVEEELESTVTIVCGFVCSCISLWHVAAHTTLLLSVFISLACVLIHPMDWSQLKGWQNVIKRWILNLAWSQMNATCVDRVILPTHLSNQWRTASKTNN